MTAKTVNGASSIKYAPQREVEETVIWPEEEPVMYDQVDQHWKPNWTTIELQ